MAVTKEEIIGAILFNARTALELAKNPNVPIVDRLANAAGSVALLLTLKMLYPKSYLWRLWQNPQEQGEARDILQEAKSIREQLVEEVNRLIEGAV